MQYASADNQLRRWRKGRSHRYRQPGHWRPHHANERHLLDNTLVRHRLGHVRTPYLPFFLLPKSYHKRAAPTVPGTAASRAA